MKDFRNKVMDGLDDKYINEAVKTYAKNLPLTGELTELKIEKPLPESRGRRIFRACAKIAAALAVVIGIGVFFKANGISVSELWRNRPSEVTDTGTTPPEASSTPDVTTPDITTTTPETTTSRPETNFNWESYYATLTTEPPVEITETEETTTTGTTTTTPETSETTSETTTEAVTAAPLEIPQYVNLDFDSNFRCPVYYPDTMSKSFAQCGYSHVFYSYDGCMYGGVYAIEDGTVLKAERNHPVYGNYVLIDHGNGYTSLYAHCSALNVSEGDSVEKGRYLCWMNNSGYTMDTGLGFGLFHNGKALNPEDYIGKMGIDDDPVYPEISNEWAVNINTADIFPVIELYHSDYETYDPEEIPPQLIFSDGKECWYTLGHGKLYLYSIPSYGYSNGWAHTRYDLLGTLNGLGFGYEEDKTDIKVRLTENNIPEAWIKVKKTENGEEISHIYRMVINGTTENNRKTYLQKEYDSSLWDSLDFFSLTQNDEGQFEGAIGGIMRYEDGCTYLRSVETERRSGVYALQVVNIAQGGSVFSDYMFFEPDPPAEEDNENVIILPDADDVNPGMIIEDAFRYNGMNYQWDMGMNFGISEYIRMDDEGNIVTSGITEETYFLKGITNINQLTEIFPEEIYDEDYIDNRFFDIGMNKIAAVSLSNQELNIVGGDENVKQYYLSVCSANSEIIDSFNNEVTYGMSNVDIDFLDDNQDSTFAAAWGLLSVYGNCYNLPRTHYTTEDGYYVTNFGYTYFEQEYRFYLTSGEKNRLLSCFNTKNVNGLLAWKPVEYKPFPSIKDFTFELIEKDKNNVHFKGIYNGQSYEFKLYSTDGVRWDVNYFGLV
ncbi:MAG: M23 family metallopeptidase [Ruminiclostridium sp.]|nr:M23 family metallopeptidase [Ruminiclostridium sp.]